MSSPWVRSADATCLVIPRFAGSLGLADQAPRIGISR